MIKVSTRRRVERVFVETDVAIRVSDSRVPPSLPPLFNFARVSLKASGLGGEVLENTAVAARSQVLRRIVKMKFLFIHGMRDSKWHRSHKCSSRWIHFHASAKTYARRP